MEGSVVAGQSDRCKLEPVAESLEAEAVWVEPQGGRRLIWNRPGTERRNPE